MNETKVTTNAVVVQIQRATKTLKGIREILEPLAKDELPENILHSLQEMVNDEDVLFVLRAVVSRYIISENRADVFDSIIDGLKNNKTKIEI